MKQSKIAQNWRWKKITCFGCLTVPCKWPIFPNPGECVFTLWCVQNRCWLANGIPSVSVLFLHQLTKLQAEPPHRFLCGAWWTWLIGCFRCISVHILTGVHGRKKRIAALKEMPKARKSGCMSSRYFVLFLFSLFCSVVHIHSCNSAERERFASACGATPVRLWQGCEGCVNCFEKPFHGSPQ